MDELPRTSDVARGIDSVQPEAFGHHGVITAWYRLKLMITWRKIGVVVSVLWLIGLPIFVMFDSNRRASEFYAWCRSAESRYATDMTPEQQLELCTRSARFMTPSLLVQVLIAGNADTFAMWILMLGPVAVFWLIFGIIFVAVRSIRNEN
jgi:hypothetical protein